MREAEAASETTPRAGEPAFFFNFVRSAYESFLAEEDERVDETKAAVAEAFGARKRAGEGRGSGAPHFTARGRGGVDQTASRCRTRPVRPAPLRSRTRRCRTPPQCAAAQHALMEEEIATKRAEKAKLAAQLAELKGQSVRAWKRRGATIAAGHISSGVTCAVWRH